LQATIRETILYKDLLVRNGNPLNEEHQRIKQEHMENHRKAKKKQASQAVNDNSSESESESEDDEPVLIKWEMEWWRKGATIVT
jgi:hypothetical protein